MSSDPVLIAVDIGNSRIKLGRFERAASTLTPTLSQRERETIGPPEPTDTLDLPLDTPTGELDVDRLSAWCEAHVGGRATWLVASVHRAAAERLAAAVADLAAEVHADWPLRRVTCRDVPLVIDVEHPERVGIDRLLAALAADRLRSPQRTAIVVDMGTAITVDRVDASGTFAGGAILPGMAMSARALHEQTDALPLVCVDHIEAPPAPVGKSSVAAIESGLFWGTIGAIRELVDRLSTGLSELPEVFVTGGSSARIADLIAAGAGRPVRYVPHLVLSGIALVDQADPSAAPDRARVS